MSAACNLTRRILPADNTPFVFSTSIISRLSTYFSIAVFIFQDDTGIAVGGDNHHGEEISPLHKFFSIAFRKIYSGNDGEQ